MRETSWHVPHILSNLNGRTPPTEILHVLFLQRLSIATRKQIVKNLSDVGTKWAHEFDPHVQPRRLEGVPWIRDYWPSSDVILEIAASAEDHKSFVIVDSGWEDATVIAAHWSDDAGGKPHLYAVRVPMGIANVLLTLLDSGKVSTFAEALGEASVEEAKVDFYKDRAPPAGQKRKTVTYEPPSFLPPNLALNKSSIEIVSLRKLTAGQIETLRNDIQGGGTNRHTRTSAKTTDVTIHNWQGPEPSRSDLRQLCDWMRENSAEESRAAPALFVDNILEDDNHAPRVVAVTVRRGQFTVFPLHSDKVVAYLENGDESEDYGMIWEKESVIVADGSLGCDEDLSVSCPVFYLKPFTLDQERTIRRALSKQCSVEEGEDWGSEFVYHGYVFPSASPSHNLQDLVDLFQRSDPKSPSYDPSSSLRLSTYPHHFVAVDERILNSEEPRVVMASSLDFSNLTTSSDSLGWLVGTVRAEEAHINFVNLDIANMGPTECFEGCKPLWLADLSAHKQETEERAKAEAVSENQEVEERDHWVGSGVW